MSLLEEVQAMMRALPDPPGRQCSVWITPHMGDGQLAIMDTAQLNAGLEIYRGRDPWPEDALLVLMNSYTLIKVKKLIDGGRYDFMASPYDDINHRLLAEWIIDGQCENDWTLGPKLRWRIGGAR